MNEQHLELLTRIDERQKGMSKTLDDILTEAKRTNGRVTLLEQDKARRSGMWKVLTIIGAVVGFILGILI